MKEIMFRLIRKNKIVGYERFQNSAWLYSQNGKDWQVEYIPHDQKEQYIGVMFAGERVYEGDILSDRERILAPGLIIWNKQSCGFRLGRIHSKTFIQNTGYNVII